MSCQIVGWSTCNPFLQAEDEKPQKNRCMSDQLQLLAAILAQWWHPVASKALDLLHWEMHAVLYQRTATAIKMASKIGPFFHYRFV
jgi:hypothetical protein